MDGWMDGWKERKKDRKKNECTNIHVGVVKIDGLLLGWLFHYFNIGLEFNGRKHGLIREWDCLETRF